MLDDFEVVCINARLVLIVRPAATTKIGRNKSLEILISCTLTYEKNVEISTFILNGRTLVENKRVNPTCL